MDKSKRFIVKSNSLVEARYRLTLQESHLILWLLTQIKPDDEDFKPHTLDVSEFCKMVKVNKGNRYNELRRITKKLMNRVMEIYEEKDESFLQVSWLSSAKYENKKGCVSLEFSPKLKPYLLNLKNQFTKIALVDTLKIKSIYGIRIFELLLQYEHLGKRITRVEDLKSFCGIKEKYKDYFDLKRKVIDKAKNEINAKTDYEIDYTPIKESRKIVALEWTIKKKQKKNTDSERKEYRSQLAIIDKLSEYGFGKALIKKTLQLHEESIVQDALKAVDIQVKKGTVKNPKAMLRTAIKERWHPEKYKNKKED